MKNTTKSCFKQIAQASGVGHMRSRLLLSLILIGPLCVGATDAFSQAQSSVQIAPRVSYSQALADDASGRHEQARKLFDALSSTEMKTDSAVPSAVNLVLLKRYADARKAFDAIANSANPREAAYAQVWQLWLSARTWEGKASDLRKQLKTQARGLQGKDAVHQALIDLYAGKGNVDAVFAAVEATPVANQAIHDDLFAEAGFFTGSWKQYVEGSASAAQELYEQALPRSSASLEHPLLKQSIATLKL